MRVEIDLIENSYDFLIESLNIFSIANIDDTHDPQRANIKYKRKLKTAFVLLVQATELLLKEVLNKINSALIYENIDVPNLEKQKTIQYSKSLERIYNLKNKFFTMEEKEFLDNCGKLRNDFIHYKPNYESFDLKMKYCKLYSLYKKIYKKTSRANLSYESEKHKNLDFVIMKKSQNLVLYRGLEYTKKQLEWYKRELEEGQTYTKIFNKKEKKYYDRILYGEENKLYYQLGKTDYLEINNVEYTYCADCAAKRGEYHLLGCDWEVCPKCGEAIIGCNCENSYVSEDDDDTKKKTEE